MTQAPSPAYGFAIPAAFKLLLDAPLRVTARLVLILATLCGVAADLFRWRACDAPVGTSRTAGRPAGSGAGRLFARVCDAPILPAATPSATDPAKENIRRATPTRACRKTTATGCNPPGCATRIPRAPHANAFMSID